LLVHYFGIGTSGNLDFQDKKESHMISNAAFDVFDMKHNVNRYVVNCITSYTEKSFRRHLQLDPHEIMEL